MNFYEIFLSKFGENNNIKVRTRYESESESESEEDSYDSENRMIVIKGDNFYFSDLTIRKDDFLKTIVSYKNKIHDRHDYIFFPFKFLMEIDSGIVQFKKNIVYEFENFITPFSESKDVINFAKPYLDNSSIYMRGLRQDIKTRLTLH